MRGLYAREGHGTGEIGFVLGALSGGETATQSGTVATHPQRRGSVCSERCAAVYGLTPNPNPNPNPTPNRYPDTGGVSVLLKVYSVATRHPPRGAMAAAMAAGDLDGHQVHSGVGVTAYTPDGGATLQSPLSKRRSFKGLSVCSLTPSPAWLLRVKG